VKPHRRGSLEGVLRVDLGLKVPSSAANRHRSTDRVRIPVTLLVALRRQSPVVELVVRLDNRARDHRLRILFPSGVRRATHSFAEGQFDVLARPISLPEAEGWKEKPYATHPMWNFVDVNDGKNGFAIINDGLTEYEVIDDRRRTVAITLLRTFDKFSFDQPTPGSQCPGPHTYRFALYPHAGGWEGSRIFRETARHVSGLQAVLSAPTKGTGPSRRRFLELEPTSLQFSGMKLSEDGKSLVVRAWNPLEIAQPLAIVTGLPISHARELTLEEEPVRDIKIDGGNRVALEAGPKKIVTLALQFKKDPRHSA
jgi:alpha-mannosidase